MQENYRYEWNTSNRQLGIFHLQMFMISSSSLYSFRFQPVPPFVVLSPSTAKPDRNPSGTHSLMDLSGDEVCQISTADSSKRATEMWSTPSGLTSASRFQGSSGSPSCQFAVDQLHFPDLVQISELHQLQRAAPHLLSQLQPSHQLLRCLIEILLCAAPSKYRLQMVLKRTVSRLCARLRSGTFQSKT